MLDLDCLLISPNARVGLTAEHIERLLAFAAAHTPRSAPPATQSG